MKKKLSELIKVTPLFSRILFTAIILTNVASAQERATPGFNNKIPESILTPCGKRLLRNFLRIVENYNNTKKNTKKERCR